MRRYEDVSSIPRAVSECNFALHLKKNSPDVLPFTIEVPAMPSPARVAWVQR